MGNALYLAVIMVMYLVCLVVLNGIRDKYGAKPAIMAAIACILAGAITILVLRGFGP